MRIRLLLLLLTLLGSACASRPGSVADRYPDRLQADELATVQDLTAEQAIRRLRPAWLARRTLPGPVAEGAGETLEPVVFIDGSLQRGFDVLAGLSVREIARMEYVGGPEATIRFGTGYSNGAILVTTHR